MWFLNVSLFDALKELTSLNLSMNEFEGWIGNEGMLIHPSNCFLWSVETCMVANG